ncbi:hypothetical protein D3C80_1966300 [compost metagenome]
MTILVILLVDVGPIVRTRRCNWFGVNARIDPCDEIELPLQTLHLPDAQPHEENEEEAHQNRQ